MAVSALRSLFSGFRFPSNGALNLGEFTLPNAIQFVPLSHALIEDEDITLDDDQQREDTMPRAAAKDKVLTVPATAVTEMNKWAVTLEANGFKVQSFGYNGDGSVVEANCVKNDRPQTITPELLNILPSN